MNTLAEVSPADLSIAASALTWTGLTPGYALNDEKAGLLLSYCGGLASAATWACVDIGRWRRAELRRRFTIGTDAYNEQVGKLYEELSGYLPSVSSQVSWRSYLNVGDAVPYADRVEGAGPSLYIPGLTLPPDVFASFVLAVAEGTHKEFLAQLYGKSLRATQIASTPNGYGPHDEPDNVPFSASAPSVWAEADETTMEYEQNSDNDLPMLSWDTLHEIQSLVTAVLLERWTEAIDLAERLEGKLQ